MAATSTIACCLALAHAGLEVDVGGQAFSGVLPRLSVTADSAPAVKLGLPKRSEAGIGALLPWADRLYMLSYLSVPGYGAGTGLYEIDEQLSITKVANHSSVFANRMIHHWTDQVVIGPYVIDAQRNIRIIESLLHVRIGAMAEHLHTPETHVYMVSMDGPLYEVDLFCLPSQVKPCGYPVHDLTWWGGSHAR